MANNEQPEINDNVRDEALLDTFKRIAQGIPRPMMRQRGDERPAKFNRVEDK